MGVGGQLCTFIKAKIRMIGEQCSPPQPATRIEERSGGRWKLFPTQKLEVIGTSRYPSELRVPRVQFHFGNMRRVLSFTVPRG